MKLGQIAVTVLAGYSLTIVHKPAFSQMQHVHPPAFFQPTAFEQPPSVTGIRWVGPAIKQIYVQCWSVNPLSPNVPVGGTKEVQKVLTFVPTPPIEKEVEISYRQENVGSFSSGGMTSKLNAEELPRGIFISFKGHPVFRIVRIEYPKTNPIPYPAAAGRIGATVTAEFLHTPTMGECYFYSAIWVAQKVG